ncbi:MAG: lytic transglycosylase domain-containing protein [Pseudomonadota bacterium]
MAAPAAPSLKPPNLHASRVVSTQDAETLRKALRAADDSNWNRVASLRRNARDPVVEDLMTWLLATSGGDVLGFDALDQVMQRMSDWPRIGAVRVAAEDKIDESALDHAQRIAWLQRGEGPISGEGKAALAISLNATGRREEAVAAAKDAWRNHPLDSRTSDRLLDTFRGEFTSSDHEARTDFLLWTGQRTAARQMKPLLNAGYRALVDARIALAVRARGVDRRVDAVPASLQDNPGLLYDRARWRRRSGLRDAALPLLVQINGEDVPYAGRDELWRERNIALRRVLRDGDADTAYRLSAGHGMTSGADFAAAEWAAGWVALRLQNDPERALGHFATLRKGVSTPVSVSRAEYWLGRTFEAMGDAQSAEEAYAAGAVHKTAFYGQLAAERAGVTDLQLPAPVAPTAADREAFEARPLVRAIRLLGEAGDSPRFRRFSFHLDDQLDNPVEHELLAEIAAEYQRPDVGVRGGKAGLARGIVPTNAAYPVLDVQPQRQARVENAFVMALSRQESELNPRAISHANARGLMQLLPSTARMQARREGLPFRTSWLTDDPSYNVTLGAAHLDDLLSAFNGSYIMTAAAYNAGESRPRRWIEEYGDPRRGEIDPVDWIEYIPFSETRNYVQRILENVQVYRNRLGQDAQIRLSEDIERGAF